MSQDDEAFQLRQEAMAIQFDNPRKALDLLWTVAREYPNTLTVANLVGDDIIGAAKLGGFWNEAIEACSLAQKLKPSFRKNYALEARACQLDKEGRNIEATEGRLKRSGGWYGDLLRFGDKFARLGAHDKAWRTYNQAVMAAARDKASPHTVRQSMAKLLLKEGKPDGAARILIEGICEAQEMKGKVPKSLLTDLRKALRAVGFNLRAAQFRGLADEIDDACRTKGRRRAVKLFQMRKSELEALR